MVQMSDLNSNFMFMIQILVVVIYTLSLLWMLLFCIAQAQLAWHYARDKKQSKPIFRQPLKSENLPRVTIQLPIYNELYVVNRLLDAVCQMDYPKERLEIQVLDDSTDETAEVLQKKIEMLRPKGIDIVYLHRKNRIDFKAGALREGLQKAKGSLIAIFDADFLPQKDWLLKTVHYFEDSIIGLVQTRWGHLNSDHSLLTKVQAFALDIHFTIEQKARNISNYFINFNGTAGIWRKTCIEDAGNWQGDTLTEDLDLSYRAQLKGWKFKYLEDVVTPAELPITVSAIRSQQFRWNKGGAENFQKLIAAFWQQPKKSFLAKIHGTLHLLSSSMFVPVFIITILSLPMLYFKNNWPVWMPFFNFTALFFIGSLLLYFSYWQFYKRLNGSKKPSWIEYSKTFILFYSVVMGFAAHNTRAVILGHRRKKSPFIRTVKFNVDAKKAPTKNKYSQHLRLSSLWIEVLICLYLLVGIYSCFTVGVGGDFGLLPFYILVLGGYATVLYHAFIPANTSSR